MKKLAAFCCILIVSCQQNDRPKDASAPGPITVISNDTIPETRASVQQAAVASYSEPVPDELNDWKFAVQVYETKRTFHFILRMQYKELRVSDSLNIPNFGIAPKPETRKGPEPLSCIIGFLDKKGEFKAYKKLAVKNDRLKFTTLNHYYTGSYRTPQKPL